MSAYNGFLDWYKGEIKEANLVSAQTLYKNSDAHVANALHHVEADFECRQAAHFAIQAGRELAGLASDMLAAAKDKEGIERARENAFAAVEELRAHCARCGPSAVARALGSE